MGPTSIPVTVVTRDHDENYPDDVDTTGVSSPEVEDWWEQFVPCQPQCVLLREPHAPCSMPGSLCVSQATHVSVPSPGGWWGFGIILLISTD